MKIRTLLLSLICVTASVPVAVNAAEKEDQTVLGSHMEKMSGAFRKLRKSVVDASQNAESLKLVATMKTEAAASLKEEPAKKAEIPAADQAKFVADYQKGMKDMAAKIDALEAALKANKNDDAAKIVEEMAAAQKQGHKAFKKQDKK